MRISILPVFLLALALFASACDDGGSNDASPTPEGGVEEPADTIAIFGGPEFSRSVLAAGTDASGIGAFLMSSSSSGDGQFDPAGVPSAPVRGAKLVPTPRDPDFAARYSAAHPDSTELPGMREAYDAVYLVALATLSANETNSALVQDHILFVANGPGEPINANPAGLPRAIEVITGGGDIDLIGTSGLLDFATNEVAQSFVSKAGAEVWTVINGTYTPLETRDVDLAAEIGAEVPQGNPDRSPAGITAPIKIGVIVSTTGEDATRGTAIVNAIQLAVDEINAAGGIGGQSLELSIKDDGGDPDAAAEASDALRAEGVVAVIGPTGSGSVLKVGDSSDTVAFLVLSSDPVIQFRIDPGILPVVPLQTMETVVLANIARELELGVACIIVEDTESASAMQSAFRDAFEAKGGQWRTPVVINPDDESDYEGAVSGCFDS